MKSSARSEALQLRRVGISYHDIQRQCGVAKSTVWRWFKAEGLVATQPQQITALRRAAQQRGAAVVKAARLARTRAILEQASQEIGELSLRDLWLLGLAMYWAEGAKQKPGNVSAQVVFSNSDPAAIRLFMRWITEMCDIALSQVGFEIYLHETADGQKAQTYWAKELSLPIERLARIRWKRHRPATRRTNVGDSYHGLIRVRVARSCDLNRKISGWIVGVNASLGSGVRVTHLALDQKTPGSSPGSPALFDEDLGAGELRESPGVWRINRRGSVRIPYGVLNGGVAITR